MASKEIGSFLQKLFFTVIIGLLLLLVYHGINLLLLLFAGILLAILWRGCSRWVAKKTKIPFKVSLPVIILLNIGSIVLFFWLSYPRIADQVDRLTKEVPKVLNEMESKMENSDVGRLLLDMARDEENGLNQLSGEMSRVLSVFTDTLGVLIDILLVLVFALFLVGNPELYVKGLLQLIPPDKRKRVHEVILETKNTLFRWFIGKIVDMFSIFVMTLIGLWLLGMPLILTFALIAFFFSFVPNIGPIISLVPPMAIALLEGPNMPLYVGLLYLGIQLFESYFITPSIQQHASYVPPVLLLLVQFLFAAFMGVLGLLLATPILVTLMVTIRMFFVEDYLGTHSTKPEST